MGALRHRVSLRGLEATWRHIEVQLRNDGVEQAAYVRVFHEEVGEEVQDAVEAADISQQI